MVQKGTTSGIGLQAFLEAAGQSLAGAQGTLGAPANLDSELVLASAELEAKVALKTDASGLLVVQPLSSQDLLLKGLTAEGISTLRVAFVATAGESTAEAAAGTTSTPTRSRDAIIDSLRERADVAAVDKILGGLTFDATFVPPQQAWVVTARDRAGRIVRNEVVEDRPDQE